MHVVNTKRRALLGGLGGLGVLAGLGSRKVLADQAVLSKIIPGTSESIPVIGMGTWITFDVSDRSPQMESRQQILQHFFAMGGTMVDSSPMYGNAQSVMGHCLSRLENDENLFSATKVWIPGQQLGIQQMQQSEEYWGLDGFDLMHVHNMVSWEAHLETLVEWKKQGRIRYHGITTSHGRRHRAMESVIESQPFDWVQFSYNILDRQAEQRLLPAAIANGKGVVINRPFRTGDLFRRVRGKTLPGWAAEIGCQNWAQFFLKFVVSHPGVTCAIPATSQLAHMQENMQAAYGVLPDQAMRQRMINYFESV